MDTKKVIRSAFTVGFFIAISRIFGLIRDISLAAFFGTSMAMSAFVVAFTIPNLFRSLFGEGALSAAFIPVFTESLKKEGKERTWRFAVNMYSILSVVLASLVIAGILIATALLFYFPGNERICLILRLLRIVLPYMFFICMAAFFAAMLNSLHYFTIPAAAPVVLNLVLIATVLLICPHLNSEGNIRIIAVAWSVVLAGVLQWLMQFPLLLRCGFRPGFSINWKDPRIRRVRQLIAVAIIGIGVTRLNVLCDRLIAVFLGPESPSYLYFAERLIYFPLGIFATALGTVLLPAFSSHAAHAQIGEIKSTLNQAIRNMIFVMLPASAGMMVLGKPIISLIYEHGGFSPSSTAMTLRALLFYAPALVMFGLLKILVPVFYAQQDMKTPVRIGCACTILNIVLSFILMVPLRCAGIALATGIASAVNVFFLAVFIHRRIGSPGWWRILASFLRISVAVAVMCIFAFFSFNWLNNMPQIQNLPDLSCKLLLVLGPIIIAVLAFLLSSFLCRCRELPEILAAFRTSSK